jgi:molybdopterin-containing oxidoreductase family iron-sulfur binding subunit
LPEQETGPGRRQIADPANDRAEYWRSLEELRHSGVSGDVAPGISEGRVGVGGVGVAARISAVDGSFSGHGRDDRVHQVAARADRSLRQAARKRVSGRADLRDGGDFEWVRQPGAGREPPGAADKIEGNDKHPASLGGTDIFTQAALLGMYDPDRSQTIMRLGEVNSWSAFVRETKGRLPCEGSPAGRVSGF